MLGIQDGKNILDKENSAYKYRGESSSLEMKLFGGLIVRSLVFLVVFKEFGFVLIHGE